ncbi:hypothetical protein D3C87_1405700 [compost metagenome]
MLVVVHHQVFLEVNGAAFGHVELVQRHGAFHRTPLADTGDIPQLRNIKGAPFHAWQVPLQTWAKQSAFEVKQAFFLPGQAFAAGGDLPRVAGFARVAGPTCDIAFQAVYRQWCQRLAGHFFVVHAQVDVIDVIVQVEELGWVGGAIGRHQRPYE